MFVSSAELVQLTGWAHASKQHKWLLSRRIRHYVNAAGRVVVMREWLANAEQPQPEPDFAALQGRA